MKLTTALGIDISQNGVRSVWLRNNMNTTAWRVEKSQSLQKSSETIASLGTGCYAIYDKVAR